MMIHEMIDNEIAAIEDEGLKHSNIDLLYKLIDIKKDITTIDAMNVSGRVEAALTAEGMTPEQIERVMKHF